MDELRWGTSHLMDEDFVRDFESCVLPPQSFHHADHVRLAWIYLRRLGEPAASDRMVESIRRFAARNGRPEKFHLTITLAWMRLIAAACRATPDVDQFKSFIEAHPYLADVGALSRHYSTDLLGSVTARDVWVEPDVCSLP